LNEFVTIAGLDDWHVIQSVLPGRRIPGNQKEVIILTNYMDWVECLEGAGLQWYALTGEKVFSSLDQFYQTIPV
jgi:hypothetical protein